MFYFIFWKTSIIFLVLLPIFIPLYWKLKKIRIHLIFLFLIIGSFLSLLMLISWGSFYFYNPRCVDGPSIEDPFGLEFKEGGNPYPEDIVDSRCTFEGSLTSRNPAPAILYLLKYFLEITGILYLIYILYRLIINLIKLYNWINFKIKDNPDFFKLKLK